MGVCVSKMVYLPGVGEKLLIAKLRTPEQITEAQGLLKLYGATRPNDPALKRFTSEMASLPGEYAPSGGEFLIAYLDEQPVGCVALRRINRAECEMKRLFTLPQYRHMGIGFQLVSVIVDIARRRGYSVMRLNTLPSMRSAQHIYESVGFVSTEPYHFNPPDGALYFALDLVAAEATACECGGAKTAR